MRYVSYLSITRICNVFTSLTLVFFFDMHSRLVMDINEKNMRIKVHKFKVKVVDEKCNTQPAQLSPTNRTSSTHKISRDIHCFLFSVFCFLFSEFEASLRTIIYSYIYVHILKYFSFFSSIFLNSSVPLISVSPAETPASFASCELLVPPLSSWIWLLL